MVVWRAPRTGVSTGVGVCWNAREGVVQGSVLGGPARQGGAGLKVLAWDLKGTDGGYLL